MPIKTIPLLGAYNQRAPREDGKISGSPTKDRRFRGVLFRPTGTPGEFYVEKRPGVTLSTTIDSGNPLFLAKASVNVSIIEDCFITTATAGATSKVYIGTTLVGTTDSTDVPGWITLVGLAGDIYYMIASIDGGAGGSYYVSGSAMAGASTFTANITSGNVTLAAVSSFSGLAVGQLLTGIGIASGARIESLNTGASTLDMTIAATSGAATSTTVTRERMSKIIDADFPTGTIGPFVELNGTIYIAKKSTGRVYGSDLNSVSSWSASNFVTANIEADELVGLARYKNQIAAFGKKSTEWYYDAGNPSGSPLSRSETLFSRIGAQPSMSPFSAIDDKLFWYGSDGGCYTLEGFSPKKISSQFIDAILFGGGTYGSIVVDAFYFKGKAYVQFMYASGSVYAITAGTSYAFWYDIEAGEWVEPNISFPCRYDSRTLSNSPIIFTPTSTSSGGYFLFDDVGASFIDNGASFSAVMQGSRQSLGTGNRKTVEYYELDSDVQASGTATLEVSDDDFATWVTVGTFDMTITCPRIYRGGSWRGGRAHRITHSANTAFRASTLTIKYREGAH